MAVEIRQGLASAGVSWRVEATPDRILVATGSAPPTFLRAPKWWQRLIGRHPASESFAMLEDMDGHHAVWYLMTDEAGTVSADRHTDVWEIIGAESIESVDTGHMANGRPPATVAQTVSPEDEDERPTDDN